MVPTVTMPHAQGQTQLSVMRLIKGLKKGEPTFMATIVSLEEYKGLQETLPPCIEKLLEENKDVMPNELPKRLPPRHEEHVEHLRKVFQVLQENELYVKREKCEFAQSKVHFLGHDISIGELCLDEAKLRPMQEWEAPIKVTELRSCLGFVNYYLQFINDYSGNAAPLTELLKKNKSWVWTEYC
ncbi:uncharacterized mitochondrial protein AtMg00860-like [Lycium barbarum]|uniref:uncharacterized mitochondrial protein AtMg00860-like n=1 Tax=Lycium barbarum TaxID=112863 RepID=UPI00293E6E09|nr:uncharacterized mitochondrial protein AtMg00860-like [Lycium barbarum]